MGGIVQIMAASIDFKKGNVFGGTVLGAYGFFWVGMALSWATMNGKFGAGLFITIASFEVNVPFIIILLLIDVLFFSLAAVSFNMGPVAVLAKLAGWSEFIISLVGFYASGAIFFKNFYGREILPLGKPLNLIKKGSPAQFQSQKHSA